MASQHFTYGVDQHCHTMVGCRFWEPTLQIQMGWAPEVD
jgi:hypothetical protein